MVSLVIVTAFTLVVTALLGSTWLDSRGVSADLRGATPALSTAETDADMTALLDTTGKLTERFAVELLPIAASLGRAADATTDAVDHVEGIREDTLAIAQTLAGLDVSASAIRELANELAPLAVSALANTGDIAAHLAQAEQEARATAALVAGALGHVREFTGDARSLRSRTQAIEATLRRIERHGKRIASADVLDCPRKLRACLS